MKRDNPNKLLFLDIDGVLNSMAFYKSDFHKQEREKYGAEAKQYDLRKLDLLKEIHDKTNCTIVMSSSWRSFYFNPSSKSRMGCGCMTLKEDLKARGIVIRHKTSNDYDERLYAIYTGCKWVEDKDGNYHTEWVEPEERKYVEITEFYERGLQIKQFKDEWEKKHGKVTFAVLDDDDGDLHLFGENFVHTSWYNENEDEAALTPAHVEKCVRLLNGVSSLA